jgi:hypothetical protein
MWKNNYVTKNVFSLLKFIFKVLCLVVLIHQIVDITNIYLQFPYEVKLNVTDYDSLNLPSITFCLKSDIFWDRFKSRGIS